MPPMDEGTPMEVGEDGVYVGATVWFDYGHPGSLIIRCFKGSSRPLSGTPLYTVEHGDNPGSIRFVYIASYEAPSSNENDISDPSKEESSFIKLAKRWIFGRSSYR